METAALSPDIKCSCGTMLDGSNSKYIGDQPMGDVTLMMYNCAKCGSTRSKKVLPKAACDHHDRDIEDRLCRGESIYPRMHLDKKRRDAALEAAFKALDEKAISASSSSRKRAALKP